MSLILPRQNPCIPRGAPCHTPKRFRTVSSTCPCQSICCCCCCCCYFYYYSYRYYYCCCYYYRIISSTAAATTTSATSATTAATTTTATTATATATTTTTAAAAAAAAATTTSSTSSTSSATIHNATCLMPKAKTPTPEKTIDLPPHPSSNITTLDALLLYSYQKKTNPHSSRAKGRTGSKQGQALWADVLIIATSLTSG